MKRVEVDGSPAIGVPPLAWEMTIIRTNPTTTDVIVVREAVIVHEANHIFLQVNGLVGNHDHSDYCLVDSDRRVTGDCGRFHVILE
jgi:hypothetical protein